MAVTSLESRKTLEVFVLKQTYIIIIRESLLASWLLLIGKHCRNYFSDEVLPSIATSIH